jgi:glycine cleavage system H protein
MTVLLFIATIAIFLTIDHFVQKRKKPVLAAQPILHKSIPLRTPPGIFFSKSHTWLSLFPSGKIQVGIDDFLARMFHKPRIAFLKNADQRVERGEPILRISEGANEIVVHSPIEGVVKSVNVQLGDKPELVTEALFSEGWAYTIAPARVGDVRGFYLGDDTLAWLKQETGRLRDFLAQLAGATPALLHDGGLPATGFIHTLEPEQCKRLEEEFLRVD